MKRSRQTPLKCSMDTEMTMVNRSVIVHHHLGGEKLNIPGQMLYLVAQEGPWRLLHRLRNGSKNPQRLLHRFSLPTFLKGLAEALGNKFNSPVPVTECSMVTGPVTSMCTAKWRLPSDARKPLGVEVQPVWPRPFARDMFFCADGRKGSPAKTSFIQWRREGNRPRILRLGTNVSCTGSNGMLGRKWRDLRMCDHSLHS